MEPPQATDSVSQTRIKKRMDDVNKEMTPVLLAN
jgi:hypothetical protein